MQKISTTLIFLVALVNLVPMSGALSADRLQALYGVAFEDANLLILMRHRAVLFGIVGGLLIASAFHLPLRPVGFAVGLTSMLSFVLIGWLVGSQNAELGRLATIDLFASVALLGAAVLDHGAKKHNGAAHP